MVEAWSWLSCGVGIIIGSFAMLVGIVLGMAAKGPRSGQ